MTQMRQFYYNTPKLRSITPGTVILHSGKQALCISITSGSKLKELVAKQK